MELDDDELLKSARLFQRNYQTGEEGLTLAAVLLLGHDDVIQSILPHYRTDALLRVRQTDRYDDRDDVRTNLIESYDRLMAFVAKHLPDRFFLLGDQRTSLRDRIFREVVANLLIHREYLDGFPAKLVIEAGRVWCENANRPHGFGPIDPASFSPFPKNPIIARFFSEIGRADELGSGVKNLYRFAREYANGAEPELIEGDVFRTIIPITGRHSQAESRDPLNAESETVDTESETVNTESETVNTESETVNTESETVNPESETVNSVLATRVRGLIAVLGYDRTDVTRGLELLLLAVHEAPGRRTREYAMHIAAGLSTTKRYLADLTRAGLVEFAGPPKTGGYYLTGAAERALRND